MAAVYEIGSEIRIRGEFRDVEDGMLVNPGGVTLQITNPAGTTTTYSYPSQVTRESTGQYLKIITPNSVGKWSYRWVSTGEGAAADPGNFKVR